ncbi:MAG: ribosomal protection-like ABC-F family protein [Bilifractor sp.]
MSAISISNLSFGYENQAEDVFENVSLQIDTEWKLGLIGRNGRGKTTFLNLLMGKYPYSGTISSSVAFEYFPCQVEDTSRNTLDIMQKVCPAAEDWELIREASLLDVEAEALYRPFSTLSNGERTKSLLAALFAGQGRFLLIDEPTNHLDQEARKKVRAYLQQKKGFILVSHDRELLDACIDHVLSINRNNIEVQQCNFSTWWENKQRQDASELAENRKLKKEISRLSDAAKRSADWADKVEDTKNGVRNSGSKIDKGYVGHKSAKMMKRAKSQEVRMQAAAEEKAGLLKNVDQAEDLKMMPLSYTRGPIVLSDGLTLYYGEKAVCSDITFQIRSGERVAIAGKNGCGKSTLLKLIAGENNIGESIRYTGTFETGSGIVISYVQQDASTVKGSLKDYARQCGVEESLLKTLLRKMGFERYELDQEIQNLSEGQKKKVLLARSLCQQADLYIWDEPLNYIDVLTRMQIEDVILKYQPTLLFVEHDQVFEKKIATRVVRL